MSMDSSIAPGMVRSLGTLGLPCPASVEGGAGVEIGEEGLEAGKLGLHVLAQLVVDLDGLGDQLLLTLERTAGTNLGPQFSEPCLGGDDLLDLVEVEADQLLELADAQDARQVGVGVAAGAARAVAGGREKSQ